MQKTYSTCIIPENSQDLLFSIRSNHLLYHCWKNTQSDTFVVIRESNNTSLCLPNQLLNLTEPELKKYLFTVTRKLKNLDDCLFFNEKLWNKYIAS